MHNAHAHNTTHTVVTNENELHDKRLHHQSLIPYQMQPRQNDATRPFALKRKCKQIMDERL